MLNLSQFLKTVDNTAAAMSKEGLTDFIHDIARTLPENAREDFLARLGGSTPGKTDAKPQTPGGEFARMRKSLKEKLERIENWELALEGCLNEEYDDWYDSSAEEFLYSDPEGVLDILQEACSFVHQCIDREAYEAASELGKILMGLDIMVGGEYQEYTDEPIHISDLQYHHLGEIDYKALVIDTAHAAYCATSLPERAEALSDILENSGRRDITLEMIMQSGRELPDMDDFLPLWIDYLGRIPADNAKRLLQEALELVGGGQQLLDSARKYCGEHPELYEQYLMDSQGKADAAALLEVGEEAMAAIDTKYLVRSRIALLTGRIALELGRQDKAEACWLEAFRSDTRVVNYLRLVMECRDFSGMQEAAKEIYRKNCPHPDAPGYLYASGGNGKENLVDPGNTYMLAFLGKEFSYVRNSAMNVKNSLGWSASFMKCGLAAFLLLLTEGAELSRGGWAMLRQVTGAVGFQAAEYGKGIVKSIEESDAAWFWTCWLRWRKDVLLSAEERADYLQWAETLVAKRVQGIMEGNHRKYYSECAAYIAALGEAKESAGQRNGKQETMRSYMEQYSRRSAFREALREYGMHDPRKKK